MSCCTSIHPPTHLPSYRMFKALRLRPRDVVALQYTRLPERGWTFLHPPTHPPTHPPPMYNTSLKPPPSPLTTHPSTFSKQNRMFKALRLRPRDVVALQYTRLPEGGLVSLQPHDASFNKLSNVHAVLEQELKYYSCVTQGVRLSLLPPTHPNHPAANLNRLDLLHPPTHLLPRPPSTSNTWGRNTPSTSEGTQTHPPTHPPSSSFEPPRSPLPSHP